MNFNAGPFDIKFTVDPMFINREIFEQMAYGPTTTGFYTYENDPNIIDSTATEIIEEEEIKEQHD